MAAGIRHEWQDTVIFDFDLVGLQRYAERACGLSGQSLDRLTRLGLLGNDINLRADQRCL